MYYRVKTDIISTQKMAYRKIAFIGVSWAMALNIITGIFSVVKISVSARILSPEDFGIFGIALLSLAFMQLLTETGLNVFLIQAKKNVSHYLDSAWVVSIIRGFVISCLLIILSPFVSHFFNSPRAFNLLILMSLIPLLQGFINPAEIIFQKELNFKYEFMFRISIYALDAFVTIVLVILTKSVFSLAFGMISGVLLEIFISFYFIKPVPKLIFNKKKLLEMFHKGKWVTFYGLLNYVAQNTDDIAVGKFLGANPLGIYQIAYKLATFSVTEVTDVVNKVFFPLYAKMSEDKEKLRSAFLKSTAVLSIIVIPINLIIFLFPKEIILLLVGSKWLGAINVLRVLAVYGMFRSLVGYPSSLFLALGHQKFVAYMTFFRAITLVITLLPFIYLFGMIGAAFAAIASVIAEGPIVVYLLYKTFK